RLFIERTITIGVGMLGAFVTLASFITILWTLSAAAPLDLFGAWVVIPGYLVWAALIYAILGTSLTHLIVWPLARPNFDQPHDGAFGSVETALSFFIAVYRDLAEWRAVIARLDGFDRSIAAARAAAEANTAPVTTTSVPPSPESLPSAPKTGLTIEGLSVQLPN